MDSTEYETSTIRGHCHRVDGRLHRSRPEPVLSGSVEDSLARAVDLSVVTIEAC